MNEPIVVRPYGPGDLNAMLEIWNEVVEEGIAFPQEACLTAKTGAAFFDSQSHCGVAETATGQILGLYILHPNNVGRCGHICNASYAVSSAHRGLHIVQMRAYHGELAAGYDKALLVNDAYGSVRGFLHLYNDALKYPA